MYIYPHQLECDPFERFGRGAAYGGAASVGSLWGQKAVVSS